ncbi:MAG: nicotinamide-nucleotide amidohydrolase family protein [Planctomycetota bacterium]
MANLSADARRLADELKRRDVKVVFAESCTGGLVAASLATVPGISDHLCGSAVTYRNDTKLQWLGVSSQKLSSRGPVSSTVAREMATGVLAMTPEADWSASVTGHLGPNAPRRLDGVVYVGIAHRENHESAATALRVTASRHVLAAESRTPRQHEAASLVLRQLLAAINAWREEQ